MGYFCFTHPNYTGNKSVSGTYHARRIRQSHTAQKYTHHPMHNKDSSTTATITQTRNGLKSRFECKYFIKQLLPAVEQAIRQNLP
ncbi:unnamed protein product [Ceratitis capitata]|uniref:(Mediterranean fruit fly) hypothetical protein n=1 Tax=Ceratitis capitata TaxID=7213 RepID=A0A811V1B1_CERCA|nr:unnamed protein product [Ceratitis capitata]